MRFAGPVWREVGQAAVFSSRRRPPTSSPAPPMAARTRTATAPSRWSATSLVVGAGVNGLVSSEVPPSGGLAFPPATGPLPGSAAGGTGPVTQDPADHQTTSAPTH